jgi:hypothetical protein
MWLHYCTAIPFDSAVQLSRLLGIHRILADKTLSQCNSRRVSYSSLLQYLVPKCLSNICRYVNDILTALGHSTAARSRANNLFPDGNHSLVFANERFEYIGDAISANVLFLLISQQCHDAYVICNTLLSRCSRLRVVQHLYFRKPLCLSLLANGARADLPHVNDNRESR